MSEMMQSSTASGVAVDAGDPAVIIQSSGSTGKPKSIVLTHANIVSACGAFFISMKLRSSVRVPRPREKRQNR